MQENSLVSEKWSPLQKMLFRLAAAYIIIYIFPFPLSMLLEAMWGRLGEVFNPLILWVGRHVLHFTWPIETEGHGSGDTSYHYIQEFIFVILAIVSAVVWSLLDRRRSNYTKLLYWIKVLVRYYLAFFLMVYGSSKFNHGQFPAPHLLRLSQPYGRSSPMGLAWTFLGYSTAYGVFMGFAECLGGLLMLFRRTALFGACIATTVVMNIVMVNFCFDVPVKLFSSHLLLFSLFILVTDGSRFLNFFIFNQPVPPVDLAPVFQIKKWKTTRIVVKVLFILVIVAVPVIECVQEFSDRETKPALYGIYNVQSFIRNGAAIPPSPADSTRWNKLIVMYDGYATVQTMNEKSRSLVFKPDTAGKTVTIYPRDDAGQQYRLIYTRRDSTLCLTGLYKNDSLCITMQRFNEKQFLLTNRGFHWINESPFNR